MKKVVIATRNKHKLSEIKDILSLSDIEILSINDFPQTGKIIEDGNSFEENAIIKAKAINKQTGLISLADDSGLEIDALDKKPGINSARFLGENTDYKIKNSKLLKMLESIPEDKRTARFVCAVAICSSQDNCKVVVGVCEGLISNSMRGEDGFGYDPIFLVPEYNKTFAELANDVKNKISHRSIALDKTRDILIDLIK